jgi:hypothetical protein
MRSRDAVGISVVHGREDVKAWDLNWFSTPDSIARRCMTAWRGVEAQHVVSTMRLVDTAAEQELLEALLEGSKPLMPATPAPKHYLLATPFRYSPTHQSRFRPAHAKGQWYGAQSIYAACAEVAYWRYRFILDSAAMHNQVLLTEHSFFQASIDGISVDLMQPPWVLARDEWTNGRDYRANQAVAAEAQLRGVQWLSYESVRAPGERCAVAFDVNCLNEPAQGLDNTIQRWVCKASRQSVMVSKGKETFAWDF